MQQLTHSNSHKRASSKKPKFNQTKLYEQVRNHLKEQINAGAWEIGAILPNEPDLARDLGVSCGTVRNALGMLEDEGVVARKQGRGTFVLDKEANDKVRRIACTHHSLFIIKAALEDAGGATISEKVHTALQKRFSDALNKAGYSGEAGT